MKTRSTILALLTLSFLFVHCSTSDIADMPGPDAESKGQQRVDSAAQIKVKQETPPQLMTNPKEKVKKDKDHD